MNSPILRSLRRMLSRFCLRYLPFIIQFAVVILFIYCFYYAGSSDEETYSDSAPCVQKINVSTNWSTVIKTMTKLTTDLYGRSGLQSKSFTNVRRKCGKRRTDQIYASAVDQTFLIEPRMCNGKVFVLIATLMSANDSHARSVIRDTWASQKYYSGEPVEFIFVIPKSPDAEVQNRLEEEADDNQDILQIDTNSNDKFSKRNVLSGLFIWIVKSCPQASYVFKTDEILFIDVFHVVQYLSTAKPSTFMCHVQTVKPNRRRHSKDYIPRYVYRKRRFPKSCMNFGYFVNTLIIKDLYMCNLLMMDQQMHLPDIYYTGIIADKLSMPREKFWVTHTWTYFKPSLNGKAMADFMFMRAAQPDIALVYWKKLWRDTLLLYYG